MKRWVSDVFIECTTRKEHLALVGGKSQLRIRFYRAAAPTSDCDKRPSATID
jgi:hypothetical protein